MKQIKFEELFTKEQMAHVIQLWCNAKVAPHKEVLAYINTQPSVLEACVKHEVFPPYLAYLIEYQLSCKSVPVDLGPLEGTSNPYPTT